MLALALPGPSSGESNVISSLDVPILLLPGVPPVELVVVEEGSLVLVLVAAVEEAEELEEDEERR